MSLLFGLVLGIGLAFWLFRASTTEMKNSFVDVGKASLVAANGVWWVIVKIYRFTIAVIAYTIILFTGHALESSENSNNTDVI